MGVIVYLHDRQRVEGKIVLKTELMSLFTFNSVHIPSHARFALYTSAGEVQVGVALPSRGLEQTHRTVLF